MRKSRLWLVLGCVNGFLAVGFGAYGAHGFEDKSDYLAYSFNVGVQYHMWHALALLAVAWVSDRYPHIFVNFAGAAFMIGILLFSGTLYVFGLTGTLPLNGAAPIGGMCFMAGWAMLALGAWRGAQQEA